MSQSVRAASQGFVRLESDTLRQQARRAIRARVVAGEIPAGQIYSVAHLASQLGVSTTPVREALLDLANEGLIEIVRNRGFQVVELSDSDLDELFELRLMLEVPAVARLAGRLGPMEIAELRRYEEEIEGYAARGDWVNFLETDRRFHLRLLEAFGNRRLVETVGRLRDQTRLYGIPALARARALGQSALEHRFILDAIEQGDSAEAATCVRRHLEHTRGIWVGRDEVTAEQG
jgi:DNA-binding GntR family transcriptional regulator